MNRVMASILILILLNASAWSKEVPVICRAAGGATEVDRWKGHLLHEAADGFSGAVVVGDGVDVLLSGEYGDADKMSGPTAFWIASISKAITAAAVLRLMEEGKIDLHASISSYLPDCDS